MQRFGTHMLTALIVALAFGGAPVRAQTETVLYTFSNGADGGAPEASLLMDKSGNLYGTTSAGGNTNRGTVFKLAPPYDQSSETVLYSFTGGADGGAPYYGSLILDKQGNLYGTTAYGGDTSYLGSGAGVVFKLSPPSNGGTAWNETVLYAFSGGTDGAYPYAGVIIDKKGNLYGTTFNGGVGGYGTVFKLAPPYGQHSETVLYNFGEGSDGGAPYAGVIMDKKGNLYGTTALSLSGGGVVYKLSPHHGQYSETVLYNFTGGADGALPEGTLILDKKGNLYGTTRGGGANQVGFGFGVVYKLSPHHGQYTETVLYTFSGGADGGQPYAGVIMDKAGNLYGTTASGGDESHYPQGFGVVYELSPPSNGGTPWNETVLYSFTGGADGGFPFGGVIMDKNGNLYGTTADDGGNGSGVVFEISP